MGQGKGHQARLASARGSRTGAGATGAPPSGPALAAQLAKQLNMPVDAVKAAAYYSHLLKARTRSLQDQRALMDGLNKNAGLHGRGVGSLGQITLRMGLPRSKLQDFVNALKPLEEHGLIKAVIPPGHLSDAKMAQIEVNSVITRAQIRKVSALSADVLVSLLDSFKGEI